ncbi:hypothetical protein B0A48_04549 [Cryoendolithus antarcticus]|uniref:Heterokaryon incompatibility domain-containing protein n=1 Tax=Cryoendolithus antarcticus TaxID=1507870 RepID=A0A1V8TG54_9PEZI|nr:hypothetical protein B0A48_04549 [Cryoendolithus antarcticus]
MRLYNVDSLAFEIFYSDPPRYIIASHRWDQGTDEVTYQDITTGHFTHKHGYRKLAGVELSEAINLMFKWYKNAAVCLAYLADVNLGSHIDSHPPLETVMRRMRQSEWFERGWTLQELVAPWKVVFISKQWTRIGDRGNGVGLQPPTLLEETLSQRTGIPIAVMCDSRCVTTASAEEKILWLRGRRTTRQEDMWYCLFGILDTPIGANYGEGYRRARKRLFVELEDIGSFEKGRGAYLLQKLAMVEAGRATLTTGTGATDVEPKMDDRIHQGGTDGSAAQKPRGTNKDDAGRTARQMFEAVFANAERSEKGKR